MSENPGHDRAAAAVDIPDVETVRLDDLLDRVTAAFERGLRFVTATCLDVGNGFEIYYHFAEGSRLSHLRVHVPPETNVPSISGVYFCAFLVENEISELFGLTFDGLALDYHGHLLLTDGGPVAPMRKTWPGGGEA